MTECPAGVHRSGPATIEDAFQLSSNRPLGRLGSPDEVARAAVFLASDEFDKLEQFWPV